jgi:hypothetical protein
MKLTIEQDLRSPRISGEFRDCPLIPKERGGIQASHFCEKKNRFGATSFEVQCLLSLYN